MWQSDFPEKFFLPPNVGKLAKNGPKTGLFEFIGKFCYWTLLNLFYNKNLYYLLCSCTNPIFGKILVPEIWAKMFSANQVAGFFNQPYLQKKLMKKPDFLHVINSHKPKFDQKIVVSPWSEMGVANLVMGL